MAKLLQEIDDVLVAAAGGDSAALARLPELVRQSPADLPLADLGANLELLIPDPQQLAQPGPVAELVSLLAARGLDTPLVRDVLAAIARQRFADYPDRAGLIAALGVRDPQVRVAVAHERFAMFDLVRDGTRVWHDSYGFGRIRSLDRFSSQVDIAFSAVRQLTLGQVLANLNLTPADSYIARLLDQQETFDRRTPAPAFDRRVAAAFLPVLVSPRQVVEALLIPRWLGPREFIAWRDAAPVPSPAPAVAAAAAAPAAGGPITWETARSLQELRLHLEGQDGIELREEHVPRLLGHYRFAASRPRSDKDFALTLARLWHLAKGQALLDELIVQLPAEAHAWATVEGFVAATLSLAAREVPGWLSVCWRARGADWFWNHVTGLPLKYWATVEDLLPGFGTDSDRLAAAAIERVRTRQAGADAMVWLWKTQPPAAEDLFGNPRVVLETLDRDVRGEFIRAHKLLRELILNAPDFHRALADQGSPEGLEALVRAVKSARALDLGEQQSLLVKLVRVFPDAMALVEDRKDVPGKRAIPLMSSYRSIEQRQRELKDLINVKIPENALAIGQARSYGDLRENFEYKAAKEQQRQLTARRRQLERDLGEIQATDFADVVAERVVVPGLSVELQYPDRGEVWHLLGLWDSDPERHILSYDTPLSRAVLGHQVGETVTVPPGEAVVIAAVRDLPPEIKEWLKATD